MLTLLIIILSVFIGLVIINITLTDITREFVIAILVSSTIKAMSTGDFTYEDLDKLLEQLKD